MFSAVPCRQGLCYGFIGLVCGRNLWIKVISHCSIFSQAVKLHFTFVLIRERDREQHMVLKCRHPFGGRQGRNLKDVAHKLQSNRVIQSSVCWWHATFMHGSVMVTYLTVVCPRPRPRPQPLASFNTKRVRWNVRLWVAGLLGFSDPPDQLHPLFHPSQGFCTFFYLVFIIDNSK